MNRRRRLLAAMLGGLLASPRAEAQATMPLETTGSTLCEVRGFATDRDPRGSNLRAAPRADAPIIGHVPPRSNIGQNTWTGAEFEIVGSKDGWLLVHNGDQDGDLKFDAAHAEDGRGWLSARLVGTTLRVAALRSAPRRDAPLVARLAGDNWGPDSVAVSAVHSCQGNYIEVTTTPIGGKPVRGWSFKPCSSQLTTCDGGITE
ncbi:MAG TPA: SH3 domain-containing protein [Reyranella sp.]|nr:SH3 domain-containing protein [Reyranella sp.]